MPTKTEYINTGEGKSEKALGEAAVGTAAIEQIGGLLRDLVKASLSNPLIGILISVITVDLLQQAGFLTKERAGLMIIIISAAAGITLSTEIVTAIGDLIPKLGGSATSIPSVITPSGNVFVFGEGQSEQLNALLSKLAKK